MLIEASELLARARKDRPNVRYALNRQRNAIAGWKDDSWQVVAAKCIDGHWLTVGNLYVDGKPVYVLTDFDESVT